MSRKRSLLAVAGMLLGVGAIGFLLVNVLAGEEPRRERRPGHAGQSADLSASQSGGSNRAVIGQRVERGDPKSSDYGTGLVDPESRAAWSSEELENQMATRSYRVIELIEAIQGSDEGDFKKRRDLLRELEQQIRMLGNRVDRGVRNRLILMLDTIEDKYRPLVGKVIGRLRGDTETAKLLVDRLKERPESVRTRKAITDALAQMQVKEVIPDLLAMLGEGHDNEEWIVDAIGRLDLTEANETLLARLDKPVRTLTKQKIIDVLGRSRDPAIMAKIEARLADAPPDLQVSYLQMLQMTRNPRHAEAVLELLDNNPEPQARQQAIKALGLFGDAESGNKLMELIQRGDPRDQAAANSALRNIKNPKTLDKMIEGWDDLSDTGRKALIGAGTNLPNPGEKLVGIAMDGVADQDSRIRVYSAQILGHSRKSKAIEPLVTLLRTAKRGSEQSQALNALRRIGTKEAAERALESLDVIPDKRRRDSYERQFSKILSNFEPR